MAASRTNLDPDFAKKLSRFEASLAKVGIKVVLTDGYRSSTEQDRLYAKGRTAPGSKVTNARGGDSWHNYGLAADYAFMFAGKVTWSGPWSTFGRIARQCGLEWGGDWTEFKDRPHVQMRQGRTLAQMRRLTAVAMKQNRQA